MKRFFNKAVFLVAGAIIIIAFPSIAAKKKLKKLGEDGYTCRVWSVTDGDTLRCGDGKFYYSIRLAGIDAPEKKSKEPGWEEAKNKLAKMTPKNMDIILNFENSFSTPECELNDPDNYYDRYGRVLAYVIIPKGKKGKKTKNANVEMVRLGMAEVSWGRYKPKKFVKEFTAAENEAMDNLRGIWSQEVYIANTLAGKEYHPKDCRHLARTEEMNLKRKNRAYAKQNGLTRCSQWDKRK